MKMAVDEGLIVRDPSDALQRHEKPKQRSRRKGRRLSPEQLEKVIETAERLTPSFAPVIVLLAHTGVRAREALGLRWADLDFDAATIGSGGSWRGTTAATSRSKPRPRTATCRSCLRCADA
jgi:integrase